MPEPASLPPCPGLSLLMHAPSPPPTHTVRGGCHTQVALLLRPGGLLIGSTLGAPEPRPWVAAYEGRPRWLHSAQSLREALEGAGLGEVEVGPTRWKVRVA